MTSPLLTAFVDASEKERMSLRYAGPFTSKQEWRVYANEHDHSEAVYRGGKDECRRFIAERATLAGMRAVREALGLYTMTAQELLNEIIGDEG